VWPCNQCGIHGNFSTATFEGSLEDQAELMNKMAPNVDAVVIITNQIGNMSDVSK